EVRGARIVSAAKSPLVAAAEWLTKKPRTASSKWKLGIDGERLSVAAHNRLVEILPRKFHVKVAPPLVEIARATKDPLEIERIRKAVLLAASLFNVVLTTFRPDVTHPKSA